MTDNTKNALLSAFNSILSVLSDFDEKDQKHILASVSNWLQISDLVPQVALSQKATSIPNASQSIANISLESDISPKEFLVEKEPESNAERVACLAYYLTHYRDTPHFKTGGIDALNTEAAQPKFSNPTVAVNNASRDKLLVASGKGTKQLSAMGEQFVLALPNREQAKNILKKMRPKRKK